MSAMKPNAVGFYKALKILELQTEEVLAIGDQASDIIAGRTAGIRTVAVTGAFPKVMAAHLRTYRPDFLIRDMQALPYLLKYLRDSFCANIKTTVDLQEVLTPLLKNDPLLSTH